MGYPIPPVGRRPHLLHMAKTPVPTRRGPVTAPQLARDEGEIRKSWRILFDGKESAESGLVGRLW